MSTLRHTFTTLLLLATACGGSKEPAGSGSTQASTGSSVGTGSGSGAAYAALGHKPANARRKTPPPEIEKAALAVGSEAPAIELVAAASGKPWTLAEALAKHTRVMLVFYRGDW